MAGVAVRGLMMDRLIQTGYCSVPYRYSVCVHFAYGRIALTLEQLGRFGQFLDKDDHCNPPVLLVPFSRLLSESKLDCIAISKVWTTG